MLKIAYAELGTAILIETPYGQAQAVVVKKPFIQRAR